jgi:hypothetical protein
MKSAGDFLLSGIDHLLRAPGKFYSARDDFIRAMESAGSSLNVEDVELVTYVAAADSSASREVARPAIDVDAGSVASAAAAPARDSEEKKERDPAPAVVPAPAASPLAQAALPPPAAAAEPQSARVMAPQPPIASGSTVIVAAPAVSMSVDPAKSSVLHDGRGRMTYDKFDSDIRLPFLRSLRDATLRRFNGGDLLKALSCLFDPSSLRNVADDALTKVP